LQSGDPENAGIFDMYLKIYIEMQRYADTKRVHSTLSSKRYNIQKWYRFGVSIRHWQRNVSDLSDNLREKVGEKGLFP